MEYIALLPTWYQCTLVILAGLIIGSFLNVLIYRFHTGRSLNGSSHCLSCGNKLRWYELFPVISYLALQGRCHNCGSYIPFRYVLVEVLTALMFIWLYFLIPIGINLLLWWLLASLLIVIVVYDLYHLIIPDELTISVGVVSLLLLFSHNSWMWSLSTVLDGVYALLLAFLVYGGLWFVSGGRWIGFGDAKLSIPLAFLLGLANTFSFVILSFWVGAVLSLLMMGLQKLLMRGQRHLSFISLPITMKSEVPFAPFLVIAFLLVALLKVNVIVLIDFFITI